MSSTSSRREGAPPIRRLRVLAGSVLLTPVLLGAVAALAVPMGDYPPAYLPLLLGAVAVGGVLLAETVGHSPPPIEPGASAEEARRIALQQYHSRWFLRSASTQAVLLLGLLLSFALVTLWPYVVAFVLGWPIMIFEVWPWRRSVDKIRLALEWAGARSYLDEVLYGRPQ